MAPPGTRIGMPAMDLRGGRDDAATAAAGVPTGTTVAEQGTAVADAVGSADRWQAELLLKRPAPPAVRGLAGGGPIPSPPPAAAALARPALRTRWPAVEGRPPSTAPGPPRVVAVDYEDDVDAATAAAERRGVRCIFTATLAPCLWRGTSQRQRHMDSGTHGPPFRWQLHSTVRLVAFVQTHTHTHTCPDAPDAR